jgi:cyclopropane fatty-acyl-phospholipid synthase-like methyltransferase
MFAQHLRIGPGHVVVDLGCGDGKICFAAAAAGAHAIGILSLSLSFLRPLSPASMQE